MDSLANLLDAVIWPAVLVGFVWYFQEQIKDLYYFLRRTIAAGGALKWNNFELKGIDISFDDRDGRTFKRDPADKNIFDKRHESYKENKNLFLVHRVRASGRTHAITKLSTYDISVYLISHKNFGRVNDVKAVEYYFGRHFGLTQSNYGTKYVVENGSEGFAVKINAYGPTLCEARILFQDGTQTTVSRYLDFEGTGYKYDPNTTNADVSKIKNRLEENG